jgi:uncharacterized protein (TIGR02246 family)
MDMASRLTADDKLEIIELATRYARAADVCDEETFGDVFAPDGVLIIRGETIGGPEEVRARLRQRWANAPEPPLGQHHVSDFVFDGDAERCTSRCYVTMLVAAADGVRTTVMGHYVDEVVKRGGRWFFAKRDYRPWTRETVASQRKGWKR